MGNDRCNVIGIEVSDDVAPDCEVYLSLMSASFCGKLLKEMF